MREIFKDIVTVHEMIKKETEEMKSHKSMSREKDDDHAHLGRRLKTGKTAADTLRNLADDVKEIRKCLNKDFRKTFFSNVCGDDSRRRRRDSGDEYRDRDGDRKDRDRGRGDRDRDDRDRGRGDRDDRDR